MTSREAFEAWLNPGKHDGNISPWVEPGRYEKDTHQLAWLAWKEAYEAGRTAEKQECKRVCELEINRLSAIGEHRAALAVGICSTKIDERGKP